MSRTQSPVQGADGGAGAGAGADADTDMGIGHCHGYKEVAGTDTDTSSVTENSLALLSPLLSLEKKPDFDSGYISQVSPPQSAACLVRDRPLTARDMRAKEREPEPESGCGCGSMVPCRAETAHTGRRSCSLPTAKQPGSGDSNRYIGVYQLATENIEVNWAIFHLNRVFRSGSMDRVLQSPISIPLLSSSGLSTSVPNKWNSVRMLPCANPKLQAPNSRSFHSTTPSTTIVNSQCVPYGCGRHHQVARLPSVGYLLLASLLSVILRIRLHDFSLPTFSSHLRSSPPPIQRPDHCLLLTALCLLPTSSTISPGPPHPTSLGPPRVPCDFYPVFDVEGSTFTTGRRPACQGLVVTRARTTLPQPFLSRACLSLCSGPIRNLRFASR